MENLETNCSNRIIFFFIDILAFELGKLCLGGGGGCFVFATRGRSFALKSCPRSGVLDGKISGPGVSRGGGGGGGMVTGQIDTCITECFRTF